MIKGFLEDKVDLQKTTGMDFVVGRTYEFDDLPEQVQDDIEVQTAEMGEDSDMYEYHAVLMDPEDNPAPEKFDVDTDPENTVDDPYVVSLVEQIKEDGLSYPPVGSEGNHRMLAYWIMKEPIPYLEMIPKD